MIFAIKLQCFIEILVTVIFILVFIILESAIWWLMDLALAILLITQIYQLWDMDTLAYTQGLLERRFRMASTIDCILIIFWLMQDDYDWVIDEKYKGQGIPFEYIAVKIIFCDIIGLYFLWSFQVRKGMNVASPRQSSPRNLG